MASRSADDMVNCKHAPVYGNDHADNLRDASEGASINDERENGDDLSIPRLLDIPMPITLKILGTHAYQQALLNRIKLPLLEEGGYYDRHTYRSAFLHDILMLPGSLANLLGKDTPEEILRRMTPALLPGFKAQIDPVSLQPRLVKSSDPVAYVQGMIIFGLGQKGRQLIHKHYRPSGTKRRKVQVEIEVATSVPESGAGNPYEEWHLQRMTTKTCAWSSDGNFHCPDHQHGVTWTLEGYLAGNLEPNETRPLRIEPNAKGDEDEDGYIGRDIEEYELKAEEREVVYGGAGHLDYERAKRFAGW